ncbi:hypothetical protein [Roseomonas gilardii]|nr:hypothetical protein [Roseomonas gilardii]
MPAFVLALILLLPCLASAQTASPPPPPDSRDCGCGPSDKPGGPR